MDRCNTVWNSFGAQNQCQFINLATSYSQLHNQCTAINVRGTYKVDQVCEL